MLPLATCKAVSRGLTLSRRMSLRFSFFCFTYHSLVSLLAARQRGPFKSVLPLAASASLSTHILVKTRPRRVLNGF